MMNTNISSRDLTLKQKSDFISKIKDMDDKGMELIYVLMRAYQNDNDEEKMTYDLPYNGDMNGNSMTFNISKLPIKLRQLLYKFMLKHTTI